MTTTLKIALYSLAFLSLAGGVLWWIMDHRRGTAWAVSVIRDRFPDVPQLTPADLQHWLNDGQPGPPVLIDARSDEEHEVSHLPDTLHLNVETVTPEALQKLDPARPYVVYCAAGYRACRLARQMHAAGIKDVRNLEGGIFAWANDDHVVQKGGHTVQQVHSYHRLFTRLLKPEHRQP